MANTYIQAIFHLVFAVKNRQALIQDSWKDDLEKYITGIVQNNGHKLLAIGTMPDHIHILIGYNLNQTIPKLVQDIKTFSSHWIKRKRFTKFRFNWQNGYGAFTHSQSQIDRVVQYVLNQKDHHRNRTFREEFNEMLIRFKINFKKEHMFEFFNEVN